jgi:hypothetical protein
MRTKLLASAAMAALIGCTTLALAQEGAKEGTKQAPGATTVAPKGGSAPGGAMQHTPTTPGGAAQNQVIQNQAIPEKQGMGPPKGAAQNEEHDATPQRGAQSNEPSKGAASANENSAQNQHGGGVTEHNAAENKAELNKASGGKPVQLSETQRTQIKSVIVKDRNVARANNVNFNITVGAAVPRSVHVAVLPADVVTIVPEYQGFDYIVVGDQLLIIDPNSMEIVAVLPA